MKSFVKRVMFKRVCNNCEETKKLYERARKSETRNATLVSNSISFSKLKDLYSHNEKILYFGEHNDEHVAIIVAWGSVNSINAPMDCSFYLNTITVNGFVRKQVLLTTFRMNKANKYDIHIDDFNGVVNQGYGTLMMEQFLEYIKVFPVNEITGYLSSSDLEERRELLHHFYKKFGFDISEDEKLLLRF